MKKLLALCAGLLMALSAFAQKVEEPTVNWPYLYPDFVEGELYRANKAPNRAKFNIHLNLGALHYINKGIIKECDTWGVTGLALGEDKFRFVGGKMMKVIAETEGGCVVTDTRANYTSIVRDDGAYGTTALHSTTTKTYLYNENAINQYNGYLMTEVYKDLHAMKNDGEKLPVLVDTYLVIGNDLIMANKKSVNASGKIDKKAFKAFLKVEAIDWDDPEDLVKVIDYITAE